MTENREKTDEPFSLEIISNLMKFFFQMYLIPVTGTTNLPSNPHPINESQ
jgi:hypothetical protein